MTKNEYLAMMILGLVINETHSDEMESGVVQHQIVIYTSHT
jgi:hypothetical protein